MLEIPPPPGATEIETYGWNAFFEGTTPIWQCPYPFHTPEETQWLNGWFGACLYAVDHKEEIIKARIT